MTFSAPRRLPLLSLLTLAAVAAALAIGGARASGAGEPAVVSGYDFAVYPSPACADPLGTRESPYFARGDCGFGEVTLPGRPDGTDVQAQLTGADGTDLGTLNAASRGAGVWRFPIRPATSWPAGPVTVTTIVNGQEAEGTGTFFVNQLGATVEPEDGTYAPGDEIPVAGRIFKQHSTTTGPQEDDTPAAFKLRLIDANGDVAGTTDELTTDDGTIDATLPGALTEDLEPTRATDYRETLRLEVVDATTDDGWAADGVTAGTATVTAAPAEPVLENSFVSSLGWVKPGEHYPFTVRVKNYRDTPLTGATVQVSAPDGSTLTTPGTWSVPDVPAAGEDGPGVREKVFEATAETLAQDPQIVWKDISSTATISAGSTGYSVRGHGPKVIPPSGGYETSRYGDRPFPVVPVDYSDRSHEEASTAGKLAGKINDPENPGSTFNLYQEMSYGQLFPNGSVPSAGVASAGWEYEPGFAFTKNGTDANTCRGVSNAALPGDAHQQLQPERIKDGWYQLPGSTDYYGDDGNGSAIIGSLAGVGALQAIDSGCGPTGKAVYDAAQIADPEIDYNDYDTDKDGVVDFFMMVFAGLGGNGDSQLNGAPPYDNIWPHSSDLQGAYSDPETGEKGYVSDDQLTDLEGRPLFWTDDSRTRRTTDDTGIPVHVRVGPYNVNPESAIEKASVISHEYGHSLGLPDYYSTGSRETYGTWNLMAADHSQNIDIVGKKELGWVVPRVLGPGQAVDATGWKDTKADTNRIDWKQPDGTPYSLTGSGVHNGEAYTAPLPRRRIIDPSLVPSGDKLQWSGSGNDFGCPPTGGHNLDIALPALADVPAGTPVTLTFKSRWDVEWDYDYGFVLTSTDNGKSYESHASENGHTTPGSQNPNANGCQQAFGNGLTGSSGSYDAGTQTVDRVVGNYPEAPFVDDEYDLSALAGKASVLRLTYATDPGLARPGWFVDDLEVKAGDRVIYSSDFEAANDPAIFNGGCREDLATAQQCTDGWAQISASDGSPAEHAYLMEMRDRSGFDAFGHGESDRGNVDWAPGLLLAYTDENHGYGNVGTDDPPAQSPLDSQPEPGNGTPDLSDAAFTAAGGDSRFSDSGTGHVDNYEDPSREDGQWRFDFDCLTFDVGRMAGQDVDEAARNLDGDVTFRTGAGCGGFDYGNGATAAPGEDGGDTDLPVDDGTKGGGGAGASSGGGGASGDSGGAAAAGAPAAVAVRSATATRPRAKAIRSFKLARRSFGGRAGALVVTFRLARTQRATLDLLRGGKVVRVVSKRTRKGGRTYRLRVGARGLARGAYRIRLRAGGATAILGARRL